MEKLEIEQYWQPELKVALFKLSGAIDVFSYLELKAAFDKWISGATEPIAVIDMTDMNYVGSSGWSVIFRQTDALDKKKGFLVFFGMSERVSRSLDILLPAKRRPLNIVPDLAAVPAMIESLKKSSQGGPA